MARQKNMRAVAKSWRAAVGGATLLVLAATAAAAQDAKKGPTSPVGGPGWNASVSAAPAVAGITLDQRQIEIVQRVSGYFSTLGDLKGTFVQTGADKKRMRGKFFMKKPGRVRFEYAPPSRQLVISDGHQIAIQDLDINTDDRVMVDQTPFRVLLRQDVDLLRDAQILEVQEADDLLIVALQDKGKDNNGSVRLFMAKTPELELKEWVTTDAQGMDTRVEVSELNHKEPVDAALFKITSPQLKQFQ